MRLSRRRGWQHDPHNGHPEKHHRARGCLRCVPELRTYYSQYTPPVFPNEAKQVFQMKQNRKRKGRFSWFHFVLVVLSALGVVYTSIYCSIVNSHPGRRRGTTSLEQLCRPSPRRTFPLTGGTTGNSLLAVHRYDLVVYSHPGSRRGTTFP